MIGLVITLFAYSSMIVSIDGRAKMSKRTFKNPKRPNPKDLPPAVTSEEHRQLIASSFPKSFDWCDKGFCHPSWNQHIPQYCGSCFMHGSMSAYQDRAMIQGVHVTLSRQSYLNCGPGRNSSNGCEGGEPSDVFSYMKKVGIPDESCLQYNATDNSKWCSPDDYEVREVGGEANCYKECPAEGECMNCMYIQGEKPPRRECWPVARFTRYRAKKWGHVKGEFNMMKEIFNHGPITCGISCPDSFSYDYRSGVVTDDMGDRDIDHDIEVVGWGIEDDENGKPVKYWKIRNSWGTYWGENGFAKIIRGKDSQSIESDCWWVEPDLSEVKLVTGVHPKLGGSHYGLVDSLSTNNAIITSSSNSFYENFLFFVMILITFGSIVSFVWYWTRKNRCIEDVTEIHTVESSNRYYSKSSDNLYAYKPIS